MDPYEMRSITDRLDQIRDVLMSMHERYLDTSQWQYLTVPASYNSTGYAFIRIERETGLIQEYSIFGDTWLKYGGKI